MPERSTIFQAVQIGAEATPGTSVAANRKLLGLGIEPSPQIEMDSFKPMGSKFVTVIQPGKDWVTANLTGVPLYSELQYPLCSALLNVTPVAGPVPSQTWTFTPTTSASDTPKTYTVEHGDGRGGKFTYGLVNEFAINIARNGSAKLDGSMIGRQYTDNITFTASPTSQSVQPLFPSQVSAYADDTSAGLGTTKLTRALTANWRISDRWGPVWTLDAANASWVAHVETDPTCELEMLLEADAQGMGFLTNARAGSTKFIRVEAIGTLITGSTFHRLRIDVAGKLSEWGDFSDEDGVYAVTLTFAAAHESGWGTGKAMELSLINSVATL